MISSKGFAGVLLIAAIIGWLLSPLFVKNKAESISLICDICGNHITLKLRDGGAK